MKEISPMKSVKTLRLKLGLSQEAFAQLIGVSFTTVNQWENGHVRPSRLAQARLAELAKRPIRAA